MTEKNTFISSRELEVFRPEWLTHETIETRLLKNMQEHRKIDGHNQIFFNYIWANCTILLSYCSPFFIFSLSHKIILFISICYWRLWALCSVIECDRLVQMETLYSEEPQAEQLAHRDMEKAAQTSSQPSQPHKHN